MLGTYWSPFEVIYEASSYQLIIAYWGFYLKASIAAIKTTDQSISEMRGGENNFSDFDCR